MVCLAMQSGSKDSFRVGPFGVTLGLPLDNSGTADDSRYPSVPQFPSQQWGASEHLLHLQSGWTISIKHQLSTKHGSWL